MKAIAKIFSIVLVLSVFVLVSALESGVGADVPSVSDASAPVAVSTSESAPAVQPVAQEAIAPVEAPPASSEPTAPGESTSSAPSDSTPESSEPTQPTESVAPVEPVVEAPSVPESNEEPSIELPSEPSDEPVSEVTEPDQANPVSQDELTPSEENAGESVDEPESEVETPEEPQEEIAPEEDGAVLPPEEETTDSSDETTEEPVAALADAPGLGVSIPQDSLAPIEGSGEDSGAGEQESSEEEFGEQDDYSFMPPASPDDFFGFGGASGASFAPLGFAPLGMPTEGEKGGEFILFGMPPQEDENETNGTVACPPPVCGNGIKEGNEECDDGNLENGDGCSSECLIEIPEPVCGDGVIEGDEQCDDGNTESGDGCSSTCMLEQIAPATIIAHKIVCNNEADLPNWGLGGQDITATTASDFIAQHPNCRFESGWNFQWVFASAANPGDHEGEVAGWNTFGSTDSNGMASVSITDLQGASRLDVREVFKQGYLPFAYESTGNNNDVSAEIYCHTDVLNYDNYDWIYNPVLGGTYYCVAWNVPLQQEPTPTPSPSPTPEPQVTIIAHKIVCDNEMDLPNWAYSDVSINSETANEFIAQHENCRFEEGWNFQWGLDYPGLQFPNGNSGEAGGNWSTIATNENGYATVTVPIEGVDNIALREVLQDGYLPFSLSSNDYSAEFYCHVDAYLYDNQELIGYTYNELVDGETYYCVAFNVPLCGNGVVDAGEQCDPASQHP
ncbi:MAG: DUF4215 domain-containing protein, partial [Candidatus Micrarchaeota archaeon]